MIRLLEMIGCPDSTLKFVPGIAATCLVCRTWTRRAPGTRWAIRVGVRSKQCFQVDLMFFECAATPLGSGPTAIKQPSDHIILQIVNERIRWSFPMESSSNAPEDNVDGSTAHWLKTLWQAGQDDLGRRKGNHSSRGVAVGATKTPTNYPAGQI